MPQTKFQDFIYTIIMVFVMVYTMICYNIANALGGMSNQVFIDAFAELPIMAVIAFLLEFFLVGKVAQKLAFRIVNPKTDKPIFVIIAISSMIVCIMCPIMSFFATVLFNFNGLSNLIANWLQAIVINFPMALCFQIFFAGPFVRLLFKRIFKKQLNEKKQLSEQTDNKNNNS